MPPDAALRARHHLALAVLGALFFLRVLGQALVAFAGVPGLPPMAEWHSGLLPYPLLLPVQLVILALMARLGRDMARGGGWARPRPRLGRALILLSAAYAAAMAGRYGLTMVWYPERRWLGTGTIPILFHWVLAAYLFVLGRYHRLAAPR
jgi:hypothetical protein